MSEGFEDPYLYPGTAVLRNRLGLRDAGELDRAERNLVRLRTREPLPKGRFDLAHLRAIHQHLFQDVYDWAGEVRTVEISKGGSAFMARRFIATGMADVHARLVRARFLRGLDRDAFAREAGRVVGDVNHVHPFREGNGRTQARFAQAAGGGGGAPARPDADRPGELDRGVGGGAGGGAWGMAEAIRGALE